MKKIIISGTILFMIFTMNLFSQQNWEFSGQIRQRFEMDNKGFNKFMEFNNFNKLRSRFGVTYKALENLTAFFQVQDSRTFGEETSTLGDGHAEKLDMHQVYFIINNLFDFPVDVKVGRMEVNFGPQRLVGAVGWHNIGRSFDGVIFKFHTKKINIDFFNFNEVEKLTPKDTGDKNVFGAYSDIKLTKSHTTQVFLIWQREIPLRNLDRYTAGFYAKGKLGNFHHETEFAYQGGKFTDKNVSALFAALDLGYTFGKSHKPDFSVGLDYLSGDDDPNDDTYKVFNTLYATNHKYYGFMDYFLNVPVHSFGLGLMDLHAKFSVSPFTKTGVKLDYHIFQAAEDYFLSDSSKSNKFGSEIDLTLKYNYSENITFVAGASLFIPDEIFKEKKGKENSSWLYFMTIVNL